MTIPLEIHDFTVCIIINKPEEVVLLGHGESKLDTSPLSQWLSVTRLPHPMCVN